MRGLDIRKWKLYLKSVLPAAHLMRSKLAC